MVSDEIQPTFGDRVRIRHAPETEALGLAGLEGVVYGQSQPSSSGVGPVIGDRGVDYAINVEFEERDEGHWFAPHLVEFIDHDPGQEMRIGDKRFVRRVDGRWEEVSSE